MHLDILELKELLLVTQAHLRVLEQLEAERIAKETGQPLQVIEQRIQTLAEEILDAVREEIPKVKENGGVTYATRLGMSSFPCLKKLSCLRRQNLHTYASKMGHLSGRFTLVPVK
ncbi:hypothetical protein [Spirosoma endophyticum]|uniref:Uncharacterized protein n=1 Tax=Spirosoma endophyticum TaxID=662367 RepID=A0A1I2GLU2_9BACT|nr:hypothetical protein [Spirosoma endophyticum]SFF17817.1 hypothetical protein SAMN05216167_13328 [Spirosoma endophyticum]